MKKLKKVVVSLVLVAAMLVGGALSASAAAEQPVVPNAAAEHSHVNCGHNVHTALPTLAVQSMLLARREMCWCGMPVMPGPSELIILASGVHKTAYGADCYYTLSELLFHFRCPAGHEATPLRWRQPDTHTICGN